MAKPSREYIYGINPAFEVIRAGRRKIYGAYLSATGTRSPRLRKLATYVEQAGIPVEWVDKKRLFDLARSKEHQGAVLRTSPYPYAPFLEQRGTDRLVLLDNVEDPHNVGAILRSAEVFGYGGVLLPVKGTPEIYPSVVKVSAGASEHLRITREMTANTYVKHLSADGYAVVALHAGGKEALDKLAVLLPAKRLLVVGGEAAAVGQYILNHADHVVGIPQRGRVNSLNASVAAGIAMYHLR